MKVESPLAGKTYNEILSLPLDTIINPTYPKIFRLPLGEAFAVACVMLGESIPQAFLDQLAKNSITGQDLLMQGKSWNKKLEVSKPTTKLQAIFCANTLKLIAQISSISYSDIKLNQAKVWAEYIANAKLLE